MLLTNSKVYLKSHKGKVNVYPAWVQGLLAENWPCLHTASILHAFKPRAEVTDTNMLLTVWPGEEKCFTKGTMRPSWINIDFAVV